MKEISESIKTVYREQKGLLVLLILNFLMGMGLLIFSLASLSPNSSVVKIGYGDLGGYRDGAWSYMLVYPLTALLFGVLHELVTLKIFRKKGAGMAMIFIIVTMFLIIGTFVVLKRLLGEG